MSSPALPVAVVCAIIKREGRLFLARRPEGKRLAGFWEFPGGKIDAGESPEVALHRELEEELSCRVVIQQTLPPFVHDYEWGSIELHGFVCALAEGSTEPHPHEHTELAWVLPGDLHHYDLAPADRPLLNSLY